MRYVDELTDALRAQLAVAAGIKDQLAYGLRSRLKEGYHAVDFRADLMAGLVVGVVALPLSMALAIASGVPPQHGLYTAIVAGIIVSLLGGTRVQVTGPTAAFVVILLPVVRDFGLPGLLVAGMMAGMPAEAFHHVIDAAVKPVLSDAEWHRLDRGLKAAA